MVSGRARKVVHMSLTLVVCLASKNLPELLGGGRARSPALLDDLDVVGPATQVPLGLHKVGQLFGLRMKEEP